MKYRTRKMVMPRDINGANALFGGRALEWIDEESAIFAFCALHNVKHLVTKKISEINFMAPARVGDILEIGNEVVRFGRTSITVSCSIRNKTTEQEVISVNEVVFVNLNDDGKPEPHGCAVETQPIG